MCFRSWTTLRSLSASKGEALLRQAAKLAALSLIFAKEWD